MILQTAQSKKVNLKFRPPVVLFLFFLITVLPQMFHIQKGDSGEVLIKAALFVSYCLISFLILLKINIKINTKQLVVGIAFLLIQTVINIIPSSYSEISVSILLNILISTVYYIFLESFLGNIKVSEKDISLFSRFYQLFIIYACVVNFSLNWGNLRNILTSLHGYAYNFQSFFSNRNTFGLFLLAGAILTLYRLRINGRNFLDVSILLLIIVNLILTLSRTSMLGLTVFLAVIVVFQHPNRYLRGLLKLFSMLIVLMLIVYISGLGDFFTHSVIRLDAGSTSRTDIWKNILHLVTGHNIFTGLGYDIESYTNTHSTYLAIFASGGILLSTFYLMVICRTVKLYKYIMNLNYQLGIYFWAALVSFLVITVTESIIPYFTSAQSMIYTILIFMIPRYYKNVSVGAQLKEFK